MICVPDAARLHKASKAARRVVVYTHKDPRQFLDRLAGEKIYKADQLELNAISVPPFSTNFLRASTSGC